MALIVNLYYTGKNGAARKFVEEMVSGGTVGEIRNERGNLRYDYFIKADDPETVLLIDGWENQEAIDLHHKSPLMEKIIELREKYDLHTTAERFIPDEGGIPCGDAEFLRK